ncbi:hypothetical protein SADUNF_Sadunf03G0064400 [Salix dunnii]|uniref:Uncharacterized protein n=1 Tax=Salix dunnii TaxID=1413687 RepID=A0A835KBN7_9ROSI|nr:hypothetical protein SADUNF_Sadunf03G0064400 [Salix dunnii]
MKMMKYPACVRVLVFLEYNILSNLGRLGRTKSLTGSEESAYYQMLWLEPTSGNQFKSAMEAVSFPCGLLVKDIIVYSYSSNGSDS